LFVFEKINAQNILFKRFPTQCCTYICRRLAIIMTPQCFARLEIASRHQTFTGIEIEGHLVFFERLHHSHISGKFGQISASSSLQLSRVASKGRLFRWIQIRMSLSSTLEAELSHAGFLRFYGCTCFLRFCVARICVFCVSHAFCVFCVSHAFCVFCVSHAFAFFWVHAFAFFCVSHAFAFLCVALVCVLCAIKSAVCSI
jgi:hypothetical protein